MERQSTDSQPGPTSPAAASIAQARAELARGQPDFAIAILERATLDHPGDFAARFALAQTLGDVALGAEDPQSQERLARSIAMLEELALRLRYQDPLDRWKVRRHLYQFRGQHLRNYRLGASEVERGNRLGHLSMGFGATGHALQLSRSPHNRTRALLWAQRGEEAWRKLFKVDRKQPNRLCNLALALALQGRFTEAEETVKEAARLARVPVEEFAQLREELREIWKTLQE